MFGYFVFQSVFSNLNFSTKKWMLRNIFSIENIVTYNISIYEDKVFFRFFDEKNFYQFVFVLKHSDSDKQIVFQDSGNILKRKIFVNNYVFDMDWAQDFMSIFVKILLSKDERFIYRLIGDLL